MNDAIRNILQEKHPAAEEAQDNVLDNSALLRVEDVIFERINGSLVQQSAQNTSGSGGPTKIDAEIWKNLICSKGYGKYSESLAEEIAVFAGGLCVEDLH